jgi:Zn-dependent M28 family amino/carboxypeptidase
MGRVLSVLLGLLLATADAASGFDGKAAWRHVERLVGFGPRPAGSAALVRTRAYIVDELKKAGLVVRLSPFEAITPDGPIKMSNVSAVIRGRRDEVIIVAGHYDTKFFAEFAFVGANDGGSSAGLLLALARRLSRIPREFTYWVVFFDGEEARASWSETDGMYGSRRLAAELRDTGELQRVRSVVVVDMIGDRRLNIRREQASTPWLTDLIWTTARRLGHGAHFSDESLAVEDDHLPFLRAGIPATLMIDLDYEPWHTARDTLSQISPRSLQVAGEVVLGSLPAIEAAIAGRKGATR